MGAQAFVKFFLLGTLFLGRGVLAQVLAPSAEEVKFRFTGEFRTEFSFLEDEGVLSDLVAIKAFRGVNVELPRNLPVWVQNKLLELTELHASHLFGLMVSPERITEEGLDPNVFSGIASLRLPLTLTIKKFKVDPNDSNFTYIKYDVKGKMLVQKRIARRWLAQGDVSFPLPYDWDKTYDARCTDHHYQSLGDYWYFWNPYREGRCERLLEEPFTQQTTLLISPVAPTHQLSPELQMNLPSLRGDNSNGDVFEISVIQGFESSADARIDEGRKAHAKFKEYLEENSFVRVIEEAGSFQEHAIYEKRIHFLGNREDSLVRIVHVLVDTDLATEGIDFAKFFKRAVRNSDVIYYGGHSGLGANLNVPALDAKLVENGEGAFEFDLTKKQIFYFDSCSSYSYYLHPFSKEKTNKSIDILSYGLSSIFGYPQVLANFMDFILSVRREDAKWMDLMKSMEAPIDGDTWLLNVGGV